MICPKCGRPVEARAVICRGCDFILDTEFLGDEILDEEQSLRPGVGGVDPAAFNLADAVILGDIDEQAQSFETSDSGFHVKESTGARLYVSGRSQAMMAPDAVPAVIEEAVQSVRLTPFEKHVLSYIDGKRPVEIIRVRAGLDESEVKTALATLADKGVVEVVGRALVENDSFQETAQRRQRQTRRNSPAMAGAMAAALGSMGDATDRAIEEAFRTQTGLHPLGAEELAPPPDDDDNVFSSLSEDPLVDAASVEDELELPHEDVGVSGADGELPGDTAYTLRPDDDLPSDADSFDVLAHTSEIERRPQVPPETRARARLAPMATNARRVLSDPELAEILADDDDELSRDTKVGEAPPAILAAASEASDGFDDFGEVSELNTALLPGVDSSLSAGVPDSEVFTSGVQTRSTPAVARPDPRAVANLLGRQRDLSESHDGTATGLRPPKASEGLSDLLDDSLPGPPGSSLSSDDDVDPDLQIDLGPSSMELDEDDGAPALAPAPQGAAEADIVLGDGGDLADLVGDDPLSLEGTDTSKVESALDARAEPDVHSVVTAAPALQVDVASDSDESVDPFADLSLEESDEAPALEAAKDESQEATAAQAPLPTPTPKPASREARGGIVVPSEDRAESSEGTAAFADNPFADELDAQGERDDDDEPSSLRPTTGEIEKSRASSEVSAVFEVDDGEGEDAHELFEGATDGVPALERGPQPNDNPLMDELSDGGAPPPPGAGELDPRNRPPQLSDGEVSSPARSFSESEELIDDAMIIRPAAASAQVRGASVLERVAPRGASPVSVEVSGAHQDVEISAGMPAPAPSVQTPRAPSSQETAHLERPQEIAALSLAAPRSRSEETALFSGAGAAIKSEVSDRSQGGAWASRPDEAAPGGAAHVSSDSTHVLAAPSGHRGPPTPPPASEASQAPAADVDGPYEALNTGSRNDPEAMRAKARKLFEDALKDFREGRIGAARMNAKLATIYDPANEEYRTALEQWGKGARRRPQQAQSYAVLYEEAQERESAGDVEGALTLLLQGAEQFPEIAAIQNRLGVLLAIHKREYDRASAYIQKAMELDPENLHYKSNLGKILSRRRAKQKRANG